MPHAIWLRTAFDNVGACQFYEHFGFQRGEVDVHPILGHRTVIYRWPRSALDPLNEEAQIS
jgi:hypothetical protein